LLSCRAAELERESELKEEGLGEEGGGGGGLGMVREEEEMVEQGLPTGFGGQKGEYMREKLMQIPADKRGKMLGQLNNLL
jgi:hypothetical protein